LEQGPGTPNTIYYGSDRLYRSADLGVTHTVVSQNPIAAGAPISAIGISRQNDNVRIVGQSTGGIFGTSVGSATLTDLDPTNVVPNNYVARAVVDPNNATTAYVTLNAFGVTNVWKTTTLSSLYDENSLAPTWTAANSGLPAVPVNAFVVDPLDSNRLYAGTDIGVYNSIDGGANWLPFGTGLPRVAVFDMAITAGRLLRIATHGRGMWQTPAVGTTASNVSVSGRILASNGSGIPRATVRMVDLQGNTREVKSNSFGYYSFEGVASGQNYAFLISAKGHEFQPQVRTISEAVDDLNFTESN